jgi:hypothetical protein
VSPPMKTCYPLHPDVFDRLYNDWATLERFQRTRGVLRLMAAVKLAIGHPNTGCREDFLAQPFRLRALAELRQTLNWMARASSPRGSAPAVGRSVL